MYQILTDSCCDLPHEFLEENHVDYISMEVTWDGKTYLDDLGKTFDHKKFYDLLKTGTMPSTTQVNIGRYVEFFTEYAKKNIPFIYIGFTSGMSGSYQSALQAARIVKEDYPDAQAEIFDSRGACTGLGLMVYDAIEKQKEGYSLQELQSWLFANRFNYNSWVTVTDLNHLYKGGRISRTSAALGGLLSIKPIISVNRAGELKVIGKVRTRHKALQRIADLTVQSMEKPEDSVVFIATSGDFESAEVAKDMILEQATPAHIQIVPMGTTISSHTGWGCIAIFVRGKDVRE